MDARIMLGVNGDHLLRDEKCDSVTGYVRDSGIKSGGGGRGAFLSYNREVTSGAQMARHSPKDVGMR